MTVAHRTSSSDPRVESNVNAALAFYTLFESDDPAALADAVDHDWTVHPPAPGAPQGIDGYRPVLAAFRVAFPDMAVTIDDAFGAADRVVVRSTMHGTHRGPFLGVSASGRRVELSTCDIHRLANGRIAQSWHIEDFFGFLAQVAATA